MSNQLAGGQKTRSRSVRVHDELWTEFGDVVDDSSRWDSRADAIRDFMTTVTEGDRTEPDDGRMPPTDDDLADAYEALLNLSPDDRWIPEDRALTILAQQSGQKKTVARQMLVLPLVERGYLKRESDVTGYTAVKALR